MIKTITILICAALLTACAVQQTLSVDPLENEGIAQYAQRLPAEMTQGVIDKLQASGRVDIEEFDSYQHIESQIRIRQPQNHIIENYRKLCKTEWFVLKNTMSCLSETNPQHPLYFITVKKTGHYRHLGIYNVNLITPKKSISDWHYLEALKSKGYQPKNDVLYHQKLANDRRQNRDRLNVMLSEAELPLKRKIGTKVCKRKPNNALLVGFVERVEAEKIQIRVVKSRLGSHLSEGGFQPHITWDNPRSWYLCHRD